MILPNATYKKVLAIIDVQPKTLRWEVALSTLEKIVSFVDAVEYDAYIIVKYYSPKSSMLYKQNDRSVSLDEAWCTDERILLKIQDSWKPCLNITKTKRSCFADHKEKIAEFLGQHKIEEIHFTWFDSNDCVLASAYDSLWCWYYSFVLEELTHHFSWVQELHDSAMILFRRQKMTNNSVHEKLWRIEIDFTP